MSSPDAPNAVVLRAVTKHFKKAGRKELRTFKTELVRLITRRKAPALPRATIPALRGIDLVVPRGKTVGIIGRNGSGKSTLLKLITGIYAPTSGTVEVNGRISALLELGAGFHPDFSGRENILINGIILGMTAREVKDRVEEIIEFSELGEFIDQPVRTYSSGMYMRLAFAVATHVDPDILIVDEILAVGDEHFGRKSSNKMKEFRKSGRTIVLVAHDLDSVQSWCDSVAWIDGGVVRAFGDPRDICNQYREAVLLAEAQGQAMLSPALAPDGGALPSLGAQTGPRSGPKVGTDQRYGNFELEIEQVRMLDGSGALANTFDGAGKMEIALDYVVHTAVERPSFGIRLLRGDGLLVGGTEVSAKELGLGAGLPPRGTVRLTIERLGLNAGTFEVEVFARRGDGVELDHHQGGLYRFNVHTGGPGVGLVKLHSRWTVDVPEVASKVANA